MSGEQSQSEKEVVVEEAEKEEKQGKECGYSPLFSKLQEMDAHIQEGGMYI